MKEQRYKTIIALNKTVDPGAVMNALGHIALGLGAMATEQEKNNMKFMPYTDANNNQHPDISAWPLIILRGSSGDIKKLRNAAQEQNLRFVDFIHTMTGGGYQEQLTNTTNVAFDDLIFYGIGIFAKPEILDSLTKRFSLWR